MASIPKHYLAKRENWQLLANQSGSSLEKSCYGNIKLYLDSAYPGEFTVVKHPDWFGQPYLEIDMELDPGRYTKPENPADKDVWFDSEKNKFVVMKGTKISVVKETFVPDCGIIHNSSGNRYVIECKMQKAEGNAHERACKYASPSIISFMKKKLNVPYHPVGYVFSGAISEDPGYCRELRAFFSFEKDHLLLWGVEMKIDTLAEWIEKTVIPAMTSVSL